jgi:hypothetical protein
MPSGGRRPARRQIPHNATGRLLACRPTGRRPPCAPHAGPAKLRAPPQRQAALGLVAEPEPSQFHQRQPCQLRAGLVDAAIPRNIPAGIGTRCQPDERSKISSTPEHAMIDLGDKNRRRYVSDAAHLRQPTDLVGMTAPIFRSRRKSSTR